MIAEISKIVSFTCLINIFYFFIIYMSFFRALYLMLYLLVILATSQHSPSKTLLDNPENKPLILSLEILDPFLIISNEILIDISNAVSSKMMIQSISNPEYSEERLDCSDLYIEKESISNSTILITSSSLRTHSIQCSILEPPRSSFLGILYLNPSDLSSDNLFLLLLKEVLSILDLSDIKEKGRSVQEEECEVGFWEYGGLCVACKYAIDWCGICSPIGVPCLACQTGFFLNTDGLCDHCWIAILNCKTCSNDGSFCIECIDSHELIGNVCVLKVEEEEFNIPGCSTYSSIDLEQCVECEEGYFLEENACTIIENLEGCVQFLSSNYCSECDSDYVLMDGKCIETGAIEGCLTYSDDTELCLICMPGTDSINNSCPVGCEIYENSICKRCKEQYYLIEGECLSEKPIDGCLTYLSSDPSVCIECGTHYELAENKCITLCRTSDGEGCLSCYTGYYLEDHECLLIPPIQGCLVYDMGDYTVCLECASGWVLEDNACIEIVILGCMEYSSYDPPKCVLCAGGWILEQDICLIPGCVKYDNHFWCLECTEMYVLENGLCKTNENENCERFENGTCMECKNGFILNNEDCVSEIENCDTYSEEYPAHCSQCEDGYLIVNNQCIPEIIGCITYSSKENSKCVECEEQYRLVDSKCYIIELNCLYYSSRNVEKCVQCEEGFRLNKGNECEEETFFIQFWRGDLFHGRAGIMQLVFLGVGLIMTLRTIHLSVKLYLDNKHGL